MTEINESVYLNAARARVRATFTFVGLPVPKDLDRTAAVAARDPVFRAAVESVWEARGRHDWRAGYDAAVEEMRGVVRRTGSPAANWAALYLDAQRRYVEARTTGSAGAALDVVRPAEDGPAERRKIFREGLGKLPIQFWVCPVPGHSQHREDAPLRQTVEWRAGVAHCLEPGCGRSSADAPAALDGGQPATPSPEEHDTDWVGYVEEDDEYAGRCACGWRTTGWSSIAVEEDLERHIDESYPPPATGETP